MNKITRKTYLEALNRVANSDDGKIVIAAIKDRCKWDAVYLASDDPVKTHTYAAVRGIYADLRKDINKKHKVSIEFDYEFEAVNAKG